MKKTEIEFNFSFEHNNLAEFKFEKKSSPRLIYPKMKATLYLTYNSVKKNLDSLLNDAYKLPYKHISKAKSIPEKEYEECLLKAKAMQFVLTNSNNL